MELTTALLAAGSTLHGISQSRQQQKAQRQAQAIQSQQAQADIAALERQRAEAEEQRRDRQERATAAQRAAFAASGVSADGSANAVFDNLLAETDKERRSFNAQIDDRIRSLQSGIQLNLLSRPSSFDPFGAANSVLKAGKDVVDAAKKTDWP